MEMPAVSSLSRLRFGRRLRRLRRAASCVIGAIALGVVKAVVGLGLLGIGILLNIGASFIGLLCVILGARPKEEASDSLKVVAVHMALLHTGKVLLIP